MTEARLYRTTIRVLVEIEVEVTAQNAREAAHQAVPRALIDLDKAVIKGHEIVSVHTAPAL